MQPEYVTLDSGEVVNVDQAYAQMLKRESVKDEERVREISAKTMERIPYNEREEATPERLLPFLSPFPQKRVLVV